MRIAPLYVLLLLGIVTCSPVNAQKELTNNALGNAYTIHYEFQQESVEYYQQKYEDHQIFLISWEADGNVLLQNSESFGVTSKHSNKLIFLIDTRLDAQEVLLKGNASNGQISQEQSKHFLLSEKPIGLQIDGIRTNLVVLK